MSCPLFLITCHKYLLFLTPCIPSSVVTANPSFGKLFPPHSIRFCGPANPSTQAITEFYFISGFYTDMCQKDTFPCLTTAYRRTFCSIREWNYYKKAKVTEIQTDTLKHRPDNQVKALETNTEDWYEPINFFHSNLFRLFSIFSREKKILTDWNTMK